VGLEAEEERADVDLALDVVRLGEGVVVEREGRVARRDLGDVVAEGGARVAVLDEVAARAGEGVAAGEARDLGDVVHAIAALGAEGERHLAGAELRPDDLDRERSEDLSERSLAREEGEEGDEAVDGGEEDEALGAEGDPLRVEAEARGAEASLVDGDSIEHGRAKRRARGCARGVWEVDRPGGRRSGGAQAARKALSGGESDAVAAAAATP
jgi:hypothetical protein